MPELPEVETVKRELAALIADHPRIERFEFLRKDLRDPMPIRRLQALCGARILAITRRAKYLLIETEKGGILSHLGMTGTWRVAGPGEELLHDHIYLYLSSGLRLAFRDPRRFGIFETYDLRELNRSPRLKSLGVEPLSDEFSAEYLFKKLKTKKAPLKTALMDQKLVVGVGNIYASEALFRAGIKPQKRSDRITKEQAQRLVESIRSVLQESIDKGGSSISDFLGTQGSEGSYQDSHQVYDRKGEMCVICSTPIKHSVMAGRSTYWCPSCQT
ncbi:MAG: bifunctional DNA-formamidopyrimidine glycosylase/DNA-(apurinic or apyrimidinic site) lyase [Pseudobdellovibrionaceae bacterium]